MTLPLIRKVQIAQKRKKIYYREGVREPTAKKYDDDRYQYDKQGYLVDTHTKERVVANSKSAGTPRYAVVNGQLLYNSGMNFHTRNKVVTTLKDTYAALMREQLQVVQGDVFPVRLVVDLYDSPRNSNWDVDNRWLYGKVLQDALVSSGILPNDDIRYISASPSIRFFIAPADRCRMVLRLVTRDEVFIDYGSNYKHSTSLFFGTTTEELITR